MESKSKINWQEYVQMFFRRKWIFVIPLVAALVLSIVVGFAVPKTYEAKAIILVEEEKIVNPLLSSLAVSSSVGDRLHKLREEILSWPRLLQLVEELNLNKDVKSSLELEELIQDLRKQILLEMRGTDIIQISYQGEDAQTTQAVVNTLCDILIKKNILAQNAEASSAIAFIEEQLGVYKEKLEQSENALRKFKETYGLQMPLATRIKEDLSSLEVELTNALVDCTEEHPRVVELRRRIESLKEKRIQQIQEAARNIDAQDYKDYINIAHSIPKQEEELARLTRDRTVNEDIHAMLLERLETARISKELESSENKTKFKIVEPARLPLKPTKPNKLKVNLFGLMLGSMVGLGSIYLVEYNDHSFKNAEDLKSMFNLSVLGSISKIITKEDIEGRKDSVKRMLIIASAVLLSLVILTAVIVRVIG